jgi:hypothetical protein
MPFNKGISGNPNGRKKGEPNKITQDLRESLQYFLETNGANFQAIFDQLEPKDKIRYYIDLLPFVIPKLQSTQLQVEDKEPLPIVVLRGIDPNMFPSDYE